MDWIATINWELILRIFIAGMLGTTIGLERMARAKDVGIRTHFVVALGSALFMVISQYAFEGKFDSARVAAQVVSGIGFLGAGVIIFQKNVVRGITTAATIWVTAAIGLAAGAGMYAIATAAALMTVICLEAMHFVSRNLGGKTLDVSISPADPERVQQLMAILSRNGRSIESFTISDGRAEMLVHYHQKDYEKLLKEILANAEGLKVEIS
ncbi:MAG: MgtC/SapB family protein [Bacteroidales bacterium]|nr:MgtC/SapB family protein [Bacteroidales bacterium]